MYSFYFYGIECTGVKGDWDFRISLMVKNPDVTNM